MPRLPMLNEEDASPELKRIFAGARQMLGFLSNSIRTVAHSPWVVRWWIPFISAVQRETGGVLSARIKEMAIIRTSKLNACEF